MISLLRGYIKFLTNNSMKWVSLRPLFVYTTLKRVKMFTQHVLCVVYSFIFSLAYRRCRPVGLETNALPLGLCSIV